MDLSIDELTALLRFYGDMRLMPPAVAKRIEELAVALQKKHVELEESYSNIIKEKSADAQ